MITDAPSVEAAVASIYDDSVSITGQRSVSGGCINQTAIVTLSNGETLFLKENSARFTDMFIAEAKGLEALAAAGGPRVPTPFAVHSGAERQFLLMEYIPSGRLGPGHYEDFGHAFAAMHADNAASAYGFEADNYIGSTPQKNPRCKSWVTFFGEHRLGYQIRRAARQGLASSELVRNVETLIGKLASLIPEPEHPSILHGDLWTGNTMCDGNGAAVMIDPAAYYGHGEADVAMTELFGRLPGRFYDAYKEIVPIGAEYAESRRTIYNLYHILNHLNLFGSSYAAQALSMTKRFI